MKSNIPYIVIGFLIALFLLQQCWGDKDKGDYSDDGNVTIDTVEVEKFIPPFSDSIVDENPNPVYIDTSSYLINKLKKEVAMLESKNARIEYLLAKSDSLIKELSYKEYDTTYVFEEHSVRLEEQVRGTVLNRNLTLEIDSIPYKNLIVKETRKIKPKWSISAGLQTGLTIRHTLEEPYLGGELGFKNENGYLWTASYNTLGQAEIGLMKDIFVYYGKN